MTKPLTKTLLGGAAALVVAAVAFSPSANAACWWDGYGWNCAVPPAYSYAPPPTVYPPYAGYYNPYAPSYGYGPDGRYPGPKTN